MFDFYLGLPQMYAQFNKYIGAMKKMHNKLKMSTCRIVEVSSNEML